MACSVWKVPVLPVIPWQMTRVFLSTKTAGGGGGDPKWRNCWAFPLGFWSSFDARFPISDLVAWRAILYTQFAFFVCVLSRVLIQQQLYLQQQPYFIWQARKILIENTIQRTYLAHGTWSSQISAQKNVSLLLIENMVLSLLLFLSNL